MHLSNDACGGSPSHPIKLRKCQEHLGQHVGTSVTTHGFRDIGAKENKGPQLMLNSTPCLFLRFMCDNAGNQQKCVSARPIVSICFLRCLLFCNPARVIFAHFLHQVHFLRKAATLVSDSFSGFGFSQTVPKNTTTPCL